MFVTKTQIANRSLSDGNQYWVILQWLRRTELSRKTTAAKGERLYAKWKVRDSKDDCLQEVIRLEKSWKSLIQCLCIAQWFYIFESNFPNKYNKKHKYVQTSSSRNSITKAQGMLWYLTVVSKTICHGKWRIIRELFFLCFEAQNFYEYLLLYLFHLVSSSAGLSACIWLYISILPILDLMSNDFGTEIPDLTIQLLKVFKDPYLNFLGRRSDWFCPDYIYRFSPGQVSHQV